MFTWPLVMRKIIPYYTLKVPNIIIESLRIVLKAIRDIIIFYLLYLHVYRTDGFIYLYTEYI